VPTVGCTTCSRCANLVWTRLGEAGPAK
jgi:hypothetical protein